MKKETLLKIKTLIVVSSFTITGCMNVSHFNKLAKSEEKESGDIIPYLELKGGEHIADLGAGGGYFSFKLAKAVGESGKIYAVDINPESIAYIKRNAADKGITNIETVLAEFDNSMLKSASVDIVFLRNAYHDFVNRVPYFTRLKAVLKPSGRIVIIDYDPSKLSFFRRMFGHAIEEKTIIDEMNSAGYVRVKNYTVLKQQSFNVFASK